MAKQKDSNATVWLDMQIGMSLDLDALEKEFGPKARTSAFIRDYAAKHYKEHTTTVTINEIDVEFE